MQRNITYRLLFPLTIMDPYIYDQNFTTLRTVVLSFFKTVSVPHPSSDGFEWAAGEHLSLRIPGISSTATAIHVSSHPNNEKVVILVATEHASSIMVRSLAENHHQNFLLNLDAIKGTIMRKLQPINDAIKAVENGWTRNGKTGLFTIENAEIMHPLADSYLPEKWV